MENEPKSLESKLEDIPTPEEIESVFKELAKVEYTEVLRQEDEKGIYRLDVTIPGEKEGEITEYSYYRKGDFPPRIYSDTEIFITYYEDDIPVGGTSVARLVDGKWKIL